MVSLFLCGVFISNYTKAQCVDSIACKLYEKNLKIVKDVIDNINSDPHLERLEAISFLIELTSIPYDGKVTFIGREFPSKKFHQKCLEWYKINQKRIFFDANLKRVTLKGK